MTVKLKFDVRYYAQVGSTMDVAKELCMDRALHGLVVQAGEQLKGRGRFGNDWVSPAGNLYLSIVLQQDKSRDECSQLSYVAAVSLYCALVISESVDQKDLKLKWPNDVYYKGQKLAGILIEHVPEKDYYIVGSGLNIQSSPPNGIHLPDLNPEWFCDLYLKQFAQFYDYWLEKGFAPIRQEWLKHALYLGENITARMADKSISGVFDSLDENGALVLILHDGNKMLISSANIQLGKKE